MHHNKMIVASAYENQNRGAVELVSIRYPADEWMGILNQLYAALLGWGMTVEF